MRKKITIWSIFGLLFVFSHTTFGLQCWQCISNDCDGDPEKNFRAEKVTCKKDGACLKVIYKMHDNKTEYASVIRTCSSGECMSTPYRDYTSCLSKDHGYLVLGCSLRLCCHDNMCNSSDCPTIVLPILLLTLIAIKILKS